MLHKIVLLIKKRTKRVFEDNLHVFVKPNKDAVWIFGFQKSGTSAIAGLLAYMTDKSVTIDTKYLWTPYSTAIRAGHLDLEKHVNRYSYPFSKDILKEPGATFYIDKIDSFFTLNKYIFITRNPFDNIRSILNRLNLPGNQDFIDLADVPPLWRAKFSTGKDYVLDLARLWLEANDQEEYMNNERCILVKYEDFTKNKEDMIASLAKDLDLPVVRSIKKIQNHQFQPKGITNANLNTFFGEKNIAVIKEVCGKRMKELNYEIPQILNQ